MDFQKYSPHSDLSSLIDCYWTLKVPPSGSNQRQRIVPDGNIEMAFILGDDIKRYVSKDEFIYQPKAMVLGQIIKPFYIEPCGLVDTFAISFHPYGLSHFISKPIKELVDKETPIAQLFEPEEAEKLEKEIIEAGNTQERIKIIELFFLDKLKETVTIDKIVKRTVDMLLTTNGKISINSLVDENSSRRRQLERKFKNQIGISPKQLVRVIRFLSSLRALQNGDKINLTDVAHRNEFYDHAHFIKDFREFTGVSPKDFIGNDNFKLSSLFYKD